jgi:hypothetical protein
MITAATLDMSKIVAGYVDQNSAEIVAAHTREREHWLRNRSAARAARIRVCCPASGQRERTLGGLATDDDHHARMRDTLLVFLQSGGSYRATAEQLMLHKNTVQYRIRKAEASLGRPRRREPPRRGTRAAGQPLARLGRAAPGPGTISSPHGRQLGRAARAATASRQPTGPGSGSGRVGASVGYRPATKP